MGHQDWALMGAVGQHVKKEMEEEDTLDTRDSRERVRRGTKTPRTSDTANREKKSDIHRDLRGSRSRLSFLPTIAEDRELTFERRISRLNMDLFTIEE